MNKSLDIYSLDPMCECESNFTCRRCLSRVAYVFTPSSTKHYFDRCNKAAFEQDRKSEKAKEKEKEIQGLSAGLNAKEE